jgi:hypothetical protein
MRRFRKGDRVTLGVQYSDGTVSQRIREAVFVEFDVGLTGVYSEAQLVRIGK